MNCQCKAKQPKQLKMLLAQVLLVGLLLSLLFYGLIFTALAGVITPQAFPTLFCNQTSIRFTKRFENT
jgi:hypothetical protein